MTEWVDNVARVTSLRERVENDPAAVAGVIEELLELAHNVEWLVQRTAIETLSLGLTERPEAGLAELECLIQTTLDSTVPCPDEWRESISVVSDEAPELACDGILDGFADINSDQRGETGARCVTRVLENIAAEIPTYIADSLGALRQISRTLPPDARAHIFGVHLELVDSHREAVRPVLTDLCSEFEAGTAETRRVAADLLCALALHPNDGPAVTEQLLRWLATHPRQPQEQRLWRHERDGAVHTTLTDTPPPGTLGLAQVVARISEESPQAVVPHATHVASSLAAWEGNQGDQWSRGYPTRALAAVARQQPAAVVSTAADIRTLLTDDADTVRYWAAHALLDLFSHRPDVVSSALLRDLLADTNPDVRCLGVTLAIECLEERIVDADAVVGAVVGDAVPTLIDCLSADSLTVRSAAAETLVKIAAARSSVLNLYLG